MACRVRDWAAIGELAPLARGGELADGIPNDFELAVTYPGEGHTWRLLAHNLRLAVRDFLAGLGE